MPDAASVDRTDAVMKRIIKIANDTPGVKDTFAISGYSFLVGANQSSAASMFIVLEPFEERVGHPEKTSLAILQKLTAAYSQIQEGVAIVIPPPPVRGIGTAGGFKMQIEDRSANGSPQDLQKATELVMAEARKRGDVFAPAMFSLFRSSVPQLYVNVDRVQVKKQDVNVNDVFNTLQVYLGSLYVNDFNFLGRTYRVVAQAEAPFRARPEDIRALQTRNQSGRMVPLGAVLDVNQIAGPDRISRYNLYRTAEINGSAAPGVSTGTAIDTIEEIARQTLPQGYSFEWTELAFQERLAGNTAFLIFPLCVLFVWLTHSAEYESFALSTAIILIVPMCLLAGIGGVWLRGMDNNIFTQIGFVVLAGLSAKNAVLIVEFAKQQNEEHGLGVVDAAIEASRLRLRPILMTSFAFILGVLPLVVAKGAGSEMRQALGTAVFYGMIGVTMFGIFLTPVFFVTIRRIFKHKPLQSPPHDGERIAAGEPIAVHA
jgi:hydrophobe/amphiphile efflux-1 (HAE1) family protein